MEIEDERLNSSFLLDLKDFMDEQEVVELSVHVSDEAFQISSNEQANFFLRKLDDLRNEAIQIELAASSELKRLAEKVNLWKDQELEKSAIAEKRILDLLEIYAASELEGTTKKSIKLPFGTLSFKKQQLKYDYDDKVLTEFLESDPNFKEKFINYKPSPKKVELKKEAKVVDGKIFIDSVEILGVQVSEQPDKFDAK
jgi:hypothetical protein